MSLLRTSRLATRVATRSLHTTPAVRAGAGAAASTNSHAAPAKSSYGSHDAHHGEHHGEHHEEVRRGKLGPCGVRRDASVHRVSLGESEPVCCIVICGVSCRVVPCVVCRAFVWVVSTRNVTDGV